MTDMETLARTGDLGDRRLRLYLDTLDVGALRGLLGAGVIETSIHEPTGPHWQPGDGRPGLADEDPVVIAAIARCATTRWRRSERYKELAWAIPHPEICGWCEYPARELLRALAWASHHGQWIIEEWEVWRRGEAVYRRPTGRAGTYAEPRFRAFAALAPGVQRRLVDEAVRASRPDPPADDVSVGPPLVSGGPDPASAAPAPFAAPVEHDPWCPLPPDHEGGCPAPEET